MSKNPKISFINEALELVVMEDFIPIENRNFFNMGYIGQIFGMVYEGIPISKEETLDKLATSKNINELIEIVRFIVGSAWIFISDKQKICFLSSTSAPSFYFYQKDDKLYFSEVESEICKIAVKKEKINHYEVYDIFAAKRFDSIPYGALFKNIKRIPDGHVLKINKNLELSYYSYLNKKHKSSIVRYDYKYFKKVLEGVAKLYVDSGKKVYMVFSGGIDSFVILHALKKNSECIHPITTAQEFEGCYDNGKIREIMCVVESEFGINVDIIHANRYSKEQRRIRDEICKLCSSNNAKWDSFVWYCMMEKFKEDTGSIFITGSEMDDGYGIGFTGIKITPELFIDPLRRYFYTKSYQRNLNGIFNKKIRKIFSKDNNMDAKTEYFSAMMYMVQYQYASILPIVKDKKYHQKNDFFKGYKEYKEEHLLKSAFPDLSEIQKLHKNDINRKIRILMHYCSIPNVIRGSFHRDFYSKQNMHHLPIEGPMVDFFCNLQLGWKDVFKPKRFLHKYFREKTGKSHTRIFWPLTVPNLIGFLVPKKYYRAEFAKIKKDIKGDRIEAKKSNPNNFTFSRVYINDFFSIVDLDNPSILKYLDDQYVEKYVKEYYANAKRGLLDFNELQNIYNLELFISNLEKDDEVQD